jgi:Asp-tRNA(Asn)/Glu-tRNA(Gln) amidotransferase A subunit family amidase
VEVVEIDKVFTEDPLNPWLSIVGACLDRSFALFAGSAAAAEADPILQMIVAGGGALSARGLIEAIDTRHFLAAELDAVLQSFDLLLCPVTAGVTPETALDGMGTVNGETTINWVQYTYPFNMTRSPAASIPVGISSSGIPIGLQVVGNWLEDHLVLEMCNMLEEILPFTLRANI